MQTRHTISKEVAENLQSEGWKLVEVFYDDMYNCDIYHLEKEEE